MSGSLDGAAAGTIVPVLAGRDAEFVPLLALTEGPRAQAQLTDSEASALVVYCLEEGHDWWAAHAMDWGEGGLESRSIISALDTASRDARLSQGARHRALRLRRALEVELLG